MADRDRQDAHRRAASGDPQAQDPCSAGEEDLARADELAPPADPSALASPPAAPEGDAKVAVDRFYSRDHPDSPLPPPPEPAPPEKRVCEDPVLAAAQADRPAERLERWAALVAALGSGPPEVLYDRRAWVAATPDTQDAAIAWVSERLAPSFAYVATVTHTCGDAGHRVATFRHERSGVLLNLLPGGWYRMGLEGVLVCDPPHSGRNPRVDPLAAPPEESVWGPDPTKPAHWACVQPFLIGRFPLTQAQWDAIGGQDDRHHRSPALPIDRMTRGALENWLRKAKDELRLPSESEWEYACRAGTTSLFFWGDAMDPAYCWHLDTPGLMREVDEHADRGNAFGLVDMLGNCREWCEDVWNDTYQGGPSSHIPRRTGLKRKGHVLRGGGASSTAAACVCSQREASGVWRGGVPDLAFGIGFRVARSLPFLPEVRPPRPDQVPPAEPTRKGLFGRLRELFG